MQQKELGHLSVLSKHLCVAGIGLCTVHHHFYLVNCAHAQERVIDTMWGMPFARSLDWSIPVNFF